LKTIDYQALGSRIRCARKNNHLTQEQLAEACSLSDAHIGHIERGTRIPSLETLVRLSEVLCVSLDWLLLDSHSSVEGSLVSISSAIRDKEPEKVKRFISTVKMMADNIDNM